MGRQQSRHQWKPQKGFYDGTRRHSSVRKRAAKDLPDYRASFPCSRSTVRWELQILSSPKATVGARHNKFRRPKEKNYLKRSVDCALRPVKQREDYNTRKRSDHQTQKDSANFWIHIQVSSLRRSVDRGIAGSKERATGPWLAAALPVLPPDCNRGDWRRHSGGSLRKPTLPKGFGRCQEQ